MLSDGSIKLPKLNWVKIKQHREIPSHHIIKSCTVSRTKTGKYYVSILTEYEHQPKPKEVQAVVGLDFSMNTLYVDSESKKVNYPRFYRHALEKLAEEQRKLSRSKKGSHRWRKQRVKVVAKLHEKIANQRKDFLHKTSYKFAKQYDCVVIEDFNIKGMAQALHFGQSVHDSMGHVYDIFTVQVRRAREKACQNRSVVSIIENLFLLWSHEGISISF